MGRLSAETEERMINIENNIVVVMLEKELERKGREEGKSTSSQDLLGPVRTVCCLQVPNISN